MRRPETKNAFDDPQHYTQHSGLQHDFALRLFQRFKPKDKVNKWLDVGCGDGSLTEKISQQLPGATVIATDVSEEMIAHAKTQYEKAVNLTFMVLAAESLHTNAEFKRQFDFIFSSFCLHWITEQKKTLDGIKQAMTDKGSALLFMPQIPPVLASHTQAMMTSDKWQTHFQDFKDLHHSYTIEKYREFLSESELEYAESHQETMTYSFDDLQQFKDFLKGWMHPVKHLPTEALKQDFLDELALHYIESHATAAAAKITYELPMLIVHIDNERRPIAHHAAV